MADDLSLDLRYGHMRRAMANAPRLSQGLRQLGAVGAHVPPPPSGSRNVVVKWWIASAGTTSAHLRYLQQEKGPERQDALLFGVQDVARVRQEARSDPHQFRLVVSALDATPRLLEPLVMDWLRQVEKDLRRPLAWVGTLHHDTPHLHAHILLRGKDREGKDLYIATPYLTQGLRDRARQFATWYLGKEITTERTQERLREMGRLLTQERQGRGMER